MPTEETIASTRAALPTAIGPRRRRFTETGLIGVLVALGLLLSVAGGSISVRNRDTGETRQVNKFLRADNLDKLAKNTSFFAIMAIGATLVIVAGGIDLSVGGIYVLSGLVGAVVLHQLGPGGWRVTWPPWCVVLVTTCACLGTGVT